MNQSRLIFILSFIVIVKPAEPKVPSHQPPVLILVVGIYSFFSHSFLDRGTIKQRYKHKLCFGGGEGKGHTQFKAPYGAAVDMDGNIFVVDRENDRVTVWTMTGDYIRCFGRKGHGNAGELDTPSGICFDLDWNVLIVDSGNCRICVFDHSGEYKFSWGSRGSRESQFSNPRGVTIDLEGNVVVADKDNSRIQIFTPKGVFIRSYGESGSERGQLAAPFGIAVDILDGRHVISDYGELLALPLPLPIPLRPGFDI